MEWNMNKKVLIFLYALIALWFWLRCQPARRPRRLAPYSNRGAALGGCDHFTGSRGPAILAQTPIAGQRLDLMPVID